MCDAIYIGNTQQTFKKRMYGHFSGLQCLLKHGQKSDSFAAHSVQHRWELPGNYPVFTMVMVIYSYVERIWIILLTHIFCITYTILNKYYPGEPVNIHIQ